MLWIERFAAPELMVETWLNYGALTSTKLSTADVLAMRSVNSPTHIRLTPISNKRYTALKVELISMESSLLCATVRILKRNRTVAQLEAARRRD
jgi:hypothetical protein